MRFAFLNVILKRLKAIRFFMADPAVPLRKKILIVGGIIYLLSPIDLIPAPVLIFSVVDDLTLWIFILYYLADELDKYWIGEDRIKDSGVFRGKTVINNARYEVHEEAEKKKNAGKE